MLYPVPTVLDAYFKNYFWTFILGSLFLAAWISAKTANLWTAQLLRPSTKEMLKAAGRTSRPKAAVATDNRSPLTAFLERNLFGSDREDLVPVPEEVEPTDAASTTDDATPIDADACNPDACQASSLGANLISTFTASEPSASAVVLQLTSSSEVKLFRVQDRILDEATVTYIGRRKMCVNRSGSCEIFTLEAPKKKVSTKRPKIAAASKSSGSEIGKNVRKLSDKEYEIPRTEIDNVLSNLNKIASQARIVPSFHNGKSNGFKLFSIRPNSLYKKIGIQNGDIVQKINGYEINSPDKALEIYSKLKSASSISVDLVRRGKPRSMTYTIR